MTIVAFPAVAAASRAAVPAPLATPRYRTKAQARQAAVLPMQAQPVQIDSDDRPWLQDDAGFTLGWDHAHHGLRPSLEALCTHPAVKRGYQAGVTVFGRRTLTATRTTRAWLALRLEALERGIRFDTFQVNARHIAQLVASHCPVTRQALHLGAPDSVILRLRGDADYVAGHLLMMSRAAWLASSRSPRVASRLDASDEARLRVLLSFGQAMPHGVAARQPLLVQPPNRLHLRNPIQALQAIASRSLVDGSAAFDEMRSAIVGISAQRDIDAFASAFRGAFDAVLTRQARADKPAAHDFRPDAIVVRHATEDAWICAEVLQAWQRVALRLDAGSAQRIVARLAGWCGSYRPMVTSGDAAILPRPAAPAVRLHA